MTAVATTPGHRARRAHPLTGLALVAGGVSLLAWLILSILQPPPEQYRYQLEKQGPVSEFPELELGELKQPLQLSRYRIELPQVAQPVATAYLADDGGQPVLVEWYNRVAEPVLYQTGPFSSLSKISGAISPPQGESVPLFGWWDVTRALALLCDCRPLFNQHHNEGLMLPSPWQPHRQQIEQAEAAFWGSSGDAEQQQLVTFAKALALPPEEGIQALQALAGDQEAVLVLNINDAYKLGTLLPKQLGIGFREFVDTGDMHGTIQRVKSWLKSEKHVHYAVSRQDDQRVRVYYLNDDRDGERLISRLLPFNKKSHIGIDGIELLMKQGEYWVYTLSPANG